MTPQKIEELSQKKKFYEDKLAFLYRNFRGVHHEDSNSELKYTQIKVYEDFIRSIDAELKALQAPASSQAHSRRLPQDSAQ
jgi:hypothetical protein